MRDQGLVFLLSLLMVICTPLSLIESKEFMRCELAKELLTKYHMDKTFLSNWVCMIEHESHRKTNEIKHAATKNEIRYGLFQIDNKKWCNTGKPGGGCNKKCEDFTDDNIADDVECAKRIFQQEGFKYWNGWQTSCRNTQNLPNLNLYCNIDKVSTIKKRYTYYMARIKRAITFK